MKISRLNRFNVTVTLIYLLSIVISLLEMMGRIEAKAGGDITMPIVLALAVLCMVLTWTPYKVLIKVALVRRLEFGVYHNRMLYWLGCLLIGEEEVKDRYVMLLKADDGDLNKNKR